MAKSGQRSFPKNGHFKHFFLMSKAKMKKVVNSVKQCFWIHRFVLYTGKIKSHLATWQTTPGKTTCFCFILLFSTFFLQIEVATRVPLLQSVDQTDVTRKGLLVGPKVVASQVAVGHEKLSKGLALRDVGAAITQERLNVFYRQVGDKT